MTNKRTQVIAHLAILTALTVVLGYYTKLPTPTGMVTLLDLGVYFTASCPSFSTLFRKYLGSGH